MTHAKVSGSKFPWSAAVSVGRLPQLRRVLTAKLLTSTFTLNESATFVADRITTVRTS